MKTQKPPKTPFYFRDGKRGFDLLLAFPGIVVLIPVFAVLAFLVWLKLGRPVLFCQQRPGINGKPFTICKFRTMTDQRDSSGNLLPDKQRLTRFGRFLRATSMDELPELWNVLLGDMSLVGPRPLLMEYLPLYNDFQCRRHELRPGITGWAQVMGRNSLSWEEKFAMDVWYVDNQSFMLDLKIVIGTIAKILKREGISQPGYATVEKFEGSWKASQKIHAGDK